MSFFSTLRLALHTLMQNKVRSVLTIIILMVVSLVVVFLFSFAFSFYASMNENVSLMVEENGVSIHVSASIDYKESDRLGKYPQLTLSDTEKVLELLDDGTGNLTYISLSGSGSYYAETSSGSAYISAQPYYAKSNPFVGKTNYLYSGRIWNSTDDNTDSIFMSKYAAQVMNANVGDTVSLSEFAYTSNGESLGETHTYTLKGIFKESGSMGNNSSCYVDYRKFDGDAYRSNNNYSNSDLRIESISAEMIPQEDELYGVAYQNYITTLAGNIKDIKLEAGFGEMGVYSMLISMLDMTNIMTLVFFGVILFISIIIILLSISSVANTVRISAEQNRKFFGVMKAIGMKNKSLRGIILTQVIIMIIIGVAIATGIAFGMSGLMSALLSTIVGSMFYSLSSTVIVSSMSPLVPIITFVLLTLFVVLFTRSSLAEISKMDVITVINEVA